tara:strand:- start:49 stop:561 length:513 start_codon:yes stop_codon:yes gene_type:complete
MAFRLKGSPMHRNFGIGSPAKQVEPTEDDRNKGYGIKPGQGENDDYGDEKDPSVAKQLIPKLAPKPDKEGEKYIMDKRQKNLDASGKKAQDFDKKFEGFEFADEDQYNLFKEKSEANWDAHQLDVDKAVFSRDSIGDVYDRYNKSVDEYNKAISKKKANQKSAFDELMGD